MKTTIPQRDVSATPAKVFNTEIVPKKVDPDESILPEDEDIEYESQ